MVGAVTRARHGACGRRVLRCAMVGAVVFATASAVEARGASAAPTECASSPTYGVGVAIIPEFVGTNTVAVTAYVGEVIDYDVTVFLRHDPPGTPNGVTVCAISNASLTIVLPDGSGPFTIAQGFGLAVGGAITFNHVPSQKYTMSTADVLTAPGCIPGGTCYDRVHATANVVATSQGPDDGQQDDEAVEATATAPTFLLAPSTHLTLSPSSSAINAGESVLWTVTETNDTPARYFPLTLSDAHVDLSTDGAVTTFARLDHNSPNFSGDTNSDGNLAVGETWTWTFITTPAADAALTATGVGTGVRGRIVTFPADVEERAASAVVVTPTTTTPPTAPPTTAPPGPPTSATAPPDSVLDESGVAPAATVPPNAAAPDTAPPTQFLPATGVPPSVVASLALGAVSLVGGLILLAISRRRALRPRR